MWLDLGTYCGPGRAHALVCYMSSRARERAVNRAWMHYVADSLQCIPQAKYLSKRFADLLTVREDFDPEDVISSVAEKGGLEVI